MIPQEVLDLFWNCSYEEHTNSTHLHSGHNGIFLRKSAFAQTEPEPCDAGVRYGNCACHTAPSSVRCPCCDNDYEKCPCECSLHYAQDRCPVCEHTDKTPHFQSITSCRHVYCECHDSWHRDRSKP